MIFDPQPFLIFAPMATVSHAGFRHLIEEWGGCSLHFTEMIDAAAHLTDRKFEHHYADASPCPEKVVFQIVGSDEDVLVAAAASLASRDCAGIDVNMGCSAPHIYRSGAGISWMTDSAKAGRLAEKLRRAVGDKTLSMKLRLGATEDGESLVALGKALQDGGADFLTLHPRVRRDTLSRPSRWEWVTVLRDALKIPVVGNGDLCSFAALKLRAARNPADGYMVGRRAVAAPWSFRYWAGRWNDPDFDFEVNLPGVCQRFHELLEQHQPPEFWITRSRRFYWYFATNLAFGHRWGARLQGQRDYQALKREAMDYWDEQPEECLSLASKLE